MKNKIIVRYYKTIYLIISKLRNMKMLQDAENQNDSETYKSLFAELQTTRNELNYLRFSNENTTTNLNDKELSCIRFVLSEYIETAHENYYGLPISENDNVELQRAEMCQAIVNKISEVTNFPKV